MEKLVVSVPIRGLFNLTPVDDSMKSKLIKVGVSVPIRGLFNLTRSMFYWKIYPSFD